MKSSKREKQETSGYREIAMILRQAQDGPIECEAYRDCSIECEAYRDRV